MIWGTRASRNHTASPHSPRKLLEGATRVLRVVAAFDVLGIVTPIKSAGYRAFLVAQPTFSGAPRIGLP
jgi:hypothetical protein